MSDNDKPTLDEEEGPFVAWGLGWAFWVQWILANGIGLSLSPLVQQAIIEVSYTGRTQIAMGMGIGLALGFAQWFIFLPQPYKVGLWWVLGNVAGWGIGWPLGWWLGWTVFAGVGFSMRYVIIGLIGGAGAGIGQWLILRPQIYRAGWWIVISVLGWGAALYFQTFTPAGNFVWTISGAVAGALTGGPLIWLLRQPVDESLQAWIRAD